jgi:hypothetical protein
MPYLRADHSASVLEGHIYIVGAWEEGQGNLRFDPASGVWSMLTATSINRRTWQSFVLSGCLYAAGGSDHMGPLYLSVERHDVASDTWTAMADMLHGRGCFGVATIESAGPAEEQDLFDSLITKASRQR